MVVRNDDEIVGLQRIGRIVANCLVTMQRAAQPGMTTAELDAIGAAFLSRHGARSAPQLDYQFPGATCISVGEQVAHGIPGARVLREGDLVNVDVSAELDGLYADTGGSFVVGEPTEAQRQICNATRRARDEAIALVRAGMPIRHIGRAIERVAAETGFRVISNLGSHGVGRKLHEEPSFIAPYEDRWDRRRLKAGQVITIEPFLTTGRTTVSEGLDGWTLLGDVGTLSAQYEHTLVVREDEPPLILTQPD